MNRMKRMKRMYIGNRRAVMLVIIMLMWVVVMTGRREGFKK